MSVHSKNRSVQIEDSVPVQRKYLAETSTITIPMRRRHVVATLASALATAGCLFESSDSQQTELGHLGLVNRDERAHRVDLRVRWGGDLVHDRRYELARDDPTDETAPGAVPEQTWPDTPGRFTIRTRLPETDWQSFDPASLEYPPCLGISIQIDSEGDLAMFHTTNRHKCDPETQDST
jgi:hypothetical protein